MAVHSVVQDKDGLRLHYDPAIVEQFSRPMLLDVALWRVWEHVACPTLILRGEQSDLLLAPTAAEMTQRGIAAARGLVQHVEIPGCGHAPALMADEQIRLVEDFLLADDAQAKRPARAKATREEQDREPAEAIAIIRDGDTVAFSGFVGSGTPEELIAALEQRFVDTGIAARPHAACSRPRPATARSAA